MTALDSDSTLICESSFALMLASSASKALIVGVGWIHAVGSLVAYVGRAGARQAEQGKRSDTLQENPISAIGLPEITKSVSNVCGRCSKFPCQGSTVAKVSQDRLCRNSARYSQIQEQARQNQCIRG